MATLNNFTVTFTKANFKELGNILGDRAAKLNIPEIKDRFMRDHFVTAESSFIIDNAYASVPNALRRVMMCEIDCYKLKVRTLVTSEGDVFADNFCKPEFVAKRIETIPLKYKIADHNAVYRLNVTNSTPCPQYVYAGDLIEVHSRSRSGLNPNRPDKHSLPFDVRYELAYLQPGKSIDIPEIVIEKGNGMLNASYQFGIRGYSIALDVPEYPESETHHKEALHADESGYKISTLMANPVKHKVRITFTQVEEDYAIIKQIHIDACDNIINRVKEIAAAVFSSKDTLGKNGNVYISGEVKLTISESEIEGVLYSALVLGVSSETFTISELLVAEIIKAVPDVSYASGDMRTEDTGLSVIIRHVDDPIKVLHDACTSIVTIFTKLRAQFSAT
jgi:DNA-directed RNA polymerase subunit L